MELEVGAAMSTPQISVSIQDEEGPAITLTVPDLPNKRGDGFAVPEAPGGVEGSSEAPAVSEISEKDKRLRHFVVKEIVETERSYLSTLDVVCKVRDGMATFLGSDSEVMSQHEHRCM